MTIDGSWWLTPASRRRARAGAILANDVLASRTCQVRILSIQAVERRIDHSFPNLDEEFFAVRHGPNRSCPGAPSASSATQLSAVVDGGESVRHHRFGFAFGLDRLNEFGGHDVAHQIVGGGPHENLAGFGGNF